MSIQQALAFQQLQQQVEQLAREQAVLAERLALLAPGECATCAGRRETDKARQQRRRNQQRHVTATAEKAVRAGPGAA